MSDIIKQVVNTMIEAELKLINSTNPYPSTGTGVWLLDESPSEIKEMYGFELKPGDFVLSYDFCTDELNRVGPNGDYPGSEKCIWYDWNDYKFFSYIYGHMAKLGYKSVDEHDGSGGGLVYGVVHFTKK